MNYETFPEDARQYLRNEFELRRQRQPTYSLRAFARDLQMSPGTLVDFYKGRMGFSKGRIEFIGQQMQMTEEQVRHFWDLLESKFARSLPKRNAARSRALRRINHGPSPQKLEAFEALGNWYHLAMVELIDLDERLANPATLARALNLSVREARDALDRLYLIDSLACEEIPEKVQHQLHAQALGLADQALEQQSNSERINTSQFVSVDSKDLPEISKALQLAVESALRPYIEKNKRNAVYCLNTQFFKIYQTVGQVDEDMGW